MPSAQIVAYTPQWIQTEPQKRVKGEGARDKSEADRASALF